MKLEPRSAETQHWRLAGMDTSCLCPFSTCGSPASAFLAWTPLAGGGGAVSAGGRMKAQQWQEAESGVLGSEQTVEPGLLLSCQYSQSHIKKHPLA